MKARNTHQNIERNVKLWPDRLIRRVRKVKKKEVENVTKNVRTSLILQSFNSKIPQTVFKEIEVNKVTQNSHPKSNWPRDEEKKQIDLPQKTGI